MRKLYVFIVFFLFVTAAIPAQAAPSLRASAEAAWYDQNIALNYRSVVIDEDEHNSGRAQAYSSENYEPWWGGGATVEASGFAWAEYGKVGVSGQTLGTVPGAGYNPPYLLYGGAGGLASFTDSWTLTSAITSPNSWGYILFTGTLDGEVSGPYSQASVGLYQMDDDHASQKGSYSTTSLLGKASFNLGTIWFQFGVPFELMFEMGGGVGVSGIVDLDHTAWISGIAVYQGNKLLTDYELASGSGVNYGFGNQTAVPEPATMLLLGLGLMGLAGVGRKLN